MPAGKLHAGQQRLKEALGYEASDVIERLVIDPEFTLSLARLMARGEVPPPTNWGEEDGIIYFTVESKALGGLDWITRLKKAGIESNASTKEVLQSPQFIPGLGTYKIAVIPSTLLGRTPISIATVLEYAAKRGLKRRPPVDVGCLIREQFLDVEIREMGLASIITMHEGVKDDDEYYHLLSADVGKSDSGGPYLGTHECGTHTWSIIGRPGPIGFAFLEL